MSSEVIEWNDKDTLETLWKCLCCTAVNFKRLQYIIQGDFLSILTQVLCLNCEYRLRRFEKVSNYYWISIQVICKNESSKHI